MLRASPSLSAGEWRGASPSPSPSPRPGARSRSASGQRVAGSQRGEPRAEAQARAATADAADGDDERPPTRVAIIGSGLSGLMCAYTLARAEADASKKSRGESGAPRRAKRRRFEVHIFEKAQTLGLDSNSILVREPGGKTSIRVDVPMRSFNSGYYPEVISLYRQLGIPIRKSEFSYSFATLDAYSASRAPQERRSGPAPELIYNGHSGLRGFGIPSRLSHLLPPSPGVLRSPAQALRFVRKELPAAIYSTREYLATVLLFFACYLRLLAYALWHHLLGHTRDPRHPLAQQQLGAWAAGASAGAEARQRRRRARINARFLDAVVVPLFSAVMTAQAHSVTEAPVAEVLEYVATTFLRSHYTVQAGVHEVQRALSEPLDPACIHTGAQVVEISDCAAGAAGAGAGAQQRAVSVLVRGADGRLQLHEGFAHCVFATQANQSADLLRKYLHRSSSADSGRSAAQTQALQTMAKQLEMFRYEHAAVINHTDRSMMPLNKRDWRDLNLVSPAAASSPPNGHASKLVELADDDASGSAAGRASGGLAQGQGQPQTQTMATHVIASDFPSTNGPQVLMQTTNPLRGMAPRPETVLSMSSFQRAVATLAGKRAHPGLFDWVRRDEAAIASGKTSLRHRLAGIVRDPLRARWQLTLGKLQGGRQRRASLAQQDERPDEAQFWVCGSWTPGIPLLEGCVRSARLVCEEIVRQEAVAS